MVVPSGDIGGVIVLSSLVARAATASGHHCTVICPRGSGHDIVEWGGAVVHTPDSIDRAAADALESCIDERAVVLATVAPETALLLPWIIEAPRGMLASFGTPTVMSGWLGHQGVRSFRCALEAAPHLQLGVSGHNYTKSASELFGVPRDRCHWLRHPIEEQPVPLPLSERTLDVLVPGRLSRERWPFVAAGAAAAEALDRPLVVHGQGPDADWIRDQLTVTTRARWVVTEGDGVRERMRESDIVVAGGLTALEAVAAECITIAPVSEGAVGIGAIATPDSLNVLCESNFQVLGESPLAPREIIRQIMGITREARAAMASSIRQQADPVVTLNGILGATVQASSGTATLDPKCIAALALERTASAQRDAAAYCEARDYFRGQAGNWEAAYRDALNACRQYEEARDFFREQADTWEKELHNTQDRVAELEQRLAQNANTPHP